MSLIITLFVREGIVMAADSRLTLSFPRTTAEGQNNTLSITSSDSAKKLFLTPNNIGIATCGPADIDGVPIAGFIESFIGEKINEESSSIEQVANELKVYFAALGVRPGTIFHVAGYLKVNEQFEQNLFFVDPAADTVTQLNTANQQGANWGGEIDVLQRLLNDVSLTQPDGSAPIPLPSFGVPFEYFTLQDAIDFAYFGIRSTIDTLKFQKREKTVGGPIDVLVITPESSHWIEQKQLSVR
jgi:20S proteasome alpha/beta subunit